MSHPSLHFCPPLRSLLLLCTLCVLCGSFVPSASAQLGPYEVRLANDRFQANLLKREKNGDIWLRRLKPDGTPGPQVGYARADILGIRMPRPSFFTNVEALLVVPASSALPPQATARAHAMLDQFVLQTRPFRDIPGVVSDEALYLKARLLDRQGKYPEALAGYEAIRAKTPPSAFADQSRIRAGIDHARLTNAVEAVECLSGIEPPEEDEALLSDMLFALGDAYTRLENWDRALMTYLSLVVFYPYVGNNEARALTRTLPCYAALNEWESLYRAIQDINATAPGTPAAPYAENFAKKYAKQLGAAGEFVDGARVVADAPATAVEGTTAATSAPSHTQFNAPSDDTPPSPDDIEYPDDLL